MPSSETDSSGADKSVPETSPIHLTRKKRSTGVVSSTSQDHQDSFIKPMIGRALRTLDINDNGFVNRRDFIEVIGEAGLKSDDPRLTTMFQALAEHQESKIPIEVLIEIASTGGSIVLKALNGQMVIPELGALKKRLQAIFDEVQLIDEGDVASYIPQLSKVPRHKFAVAVTTVDGQQFSIGDDADFFCLQSVSKVVTYCEAVKQHGTEEVHLHVGREPSGLNFNAMVMKPVAKLDKYPDREAIPHNPLINSGAIMCCSLMNPQLPLSERLAEYLTTWSRMAGETVGFDPTVMMSERSTADRNNVLAYMMRESGAYADPDMDVDELLELYFSTCSVTCNVSMLATAASVFANCGVNPLTNDCIYDSETCRNALSLMLSCGMYDFSGEWAFTVGLPAKSGVSGAILLVIPDVLGMCIWSPPLDQNGNSVKGVEFAKRLVDEFSFHSFEPKRNMTAQKNNVARSDLSQTAQTMMELMLAAAADDLAAIQRLVATGADINEPDYDQRTVLHIAASDGRTEIVRFLLHHGANPTMKDRWGNKAIDDAKRGQHKAIVDLLAAGNGQNVANAKLL